jgi:hypothetical protein
VTDQATLEESKPTPASGSAKTSKPTVSLTNPEAIAIAQATVIAALLDGASLAEAASRAGVHRQRVWEWRQTEDFTRRIRDATLQLSEQLVADGIEQARAMLRALAIPSVLRLGKIVSEGSDTDANRAIESVLRRVTELPTVDGGVGSLEALLAGIGDAQSD